MTSHEIDVLIQARLEGEQAMADARAAISRIQDALDSFRVAEAAGLSADEAMRRAIGAQMEAALRAGVGFKELASRIADVRQAMTHYREAIAGGLPIDEAELSIIRDTIDAIKDENDAIKDQTAALRGLMLQTGWNTTFGEALTLQEKSYAIAQMASTAATTASTAAGAAAWPVWAIMAAVIVPLVLSLSAFIIVAGSAAVVLATFAAAGAATLALLGGLALGFGAIGAAMVLLGGGGGVGAAASLATATTQLSTAQNALRDFNTLHPGVTAGAPTSLGLQKEDLTLAAANAQTKYNDALTASQGPTGVLIAQLTAVKDAWALQAAPMALVITQWLSGALPGVQALGSSLMTWFGARLPGVLKDIGNVVTFLAPHFQQFGEFLGRMFDRFSPQMGPLIESAFLVIIPAVEGLLSNLANLSQWFIDRLPKYGPIVMQIFGVMGSIIQWVAGVWGQLADWIVAHWPAITKLVADAIANITYQWDKWAPFLQPLIHDMLPAVGAALTIIANNAGILVPALALVLGAVVIIGTSLLLMVAAGMQVISWIQNLIFWFGQARLSIVGDINFLIDALNVLITGINSIPMLGVHIAYIGNIVSSAGTNITAGGAGHAIGPGIRRAATGFEGLVTRPTLFLAGEGGSPESVSIRPQGGAGGGGPTLVMNIYGNVQTERSLLLAMREGIRRLDREMR